MKLTDPMHAEVSFSLLLDGTAVLDDLPGEAVQIDGRWLVSKRTVLRCRHPGHDRAAPAALMSSLRMMTPR